MYSEWADVGGNFWFQNVPLALGSGNTQCETDFQASDLIDNIKVD